MFDHTARALAWLRAGQGLQQKELSERSGVGRAAISRYEAGKASPSLENLGRLLEALEVGPRDFAYCLERLREDAEGIPPTGGRQALRRRSTGGTGMAPGAYVLVDLSGDPEMDDARARRAVRAVAHLTDRREGRS